MRVAVIGASGFIGRYVLAELAMREGDIPGKQPAHLNMACRQNRHLASSLSGKRSQRYTRRPRRMICEA
jgi:uncharacterized protein YbjT (DUF2867 family)